MGKNGLFKAIPFLFVILISLYSIISLSQKNSLNEKDKVYEGIHTIRKDIYLLADEQFHFDQVIRIINGNKQLNEALTTLPGYHFAVAIPAKITGLVSSIGIRIWALIVNLLLIPVIYLLAKTLDNKTAFIRTLQIIFFPLVMPFFPLMYTDLLSLTLLLFMFYLVINKKYLLSGIIGLLCLAVRQNNVVWIMLFLIYSYCQEYRAFSTWKESLHATFQVFIRLFPLIIDIFIFIIFVWINKGISMAQSDLHPTFSIHLGNLYFLFFVFFLLFLPYIIFNFKRTLLFIKRYLLYILPVFLFGLALFLVTFKLDHPFNRIPGFLRNDLLMFAGNRIWVKLIIFTLGFVSFATILTEKYKNKIYNIYYLPVILLLLNSWLIEVRYYLVPFVLFNIFRNKMSEKGEWVIAIYNAVFSIMILWMFLGRKYFI